MRGLLKISVLVSGFLVFSSMVLVWAQAPQASQENRRFGAGSLEEKLEKTGPGGPAPKKSIVGFWAGPASAKINEIAPMTPWGQEQFKTHKSSGEYPVSESNDPLKTCDPLGFPRNMLYQSRGVAFAEMPDRFIAMSEYNRVWREIWTDGRPLPKDIGGDAPNAPDTRWYGYSVGHWVDDYNFVVESTGANENTWLDSAGHPHTADMKVEERYTRQDHNTLILTMTITDPKAYTRPFVITKQPYKWIPEQEFDEQICVPSDMLQYLSIIAEPAVKPAGKK